MRWPLIAAAVGTALVLGGCGKNIPPESNSRSVFAMDTYMTVTVNDGRIGDALNGAETELKRLDGLWSVTTEGSDMYRLDNAGGAPTEVSPETAELIAFGQEMYDLTDGALDITLYPVVREWGFTTGEYKIPDQAAIDGLLKNTGADRITVSGNTVTLPQGMSADLGSLGKGAAGDAVTAILKKNGVTSALLDLGGNVQVIGAKPDGSPWRIGLRDPWSEGSLGRLELTDCAVVTSGGYERFFVGEDGVTYWHILDPETGCPARSGIASATAVGKEGRLCDGLSTSLFVLGEEGAEELWRSMDSFDMILVTDDRRLIITEGIADSFTLGESYEGVIKTEVLRR